MKKNILSLFVLLAALAVFAGCSHDDKTEIINIIEGGQQVTGLPDDWKAVHEDNIYPKSMMVIIDQTGIPTEIGTNDRLAAFVGGVCRAVAEPFTGTEGYTRYQFKISLPASMVVAGGNNVELRYYSDKNHLIFTSQPIPFVEDSHLGEYMKGYKPVWKK